MKRILSLVVLLLVSFVGFAQAPSNYTNINGRYRWIAGMFDSTFSLPKGATPSLRTGGSSNPGALFYRTTDSTVKYWTGTQWLTVADTTRYVPYVGATKNVNLGQYGLKSKYLEFDTSSQAVTERRLQWSNDDGTLQFGMTNGSTITNRIGLEQFARVKNVDATQINKGDVVYLFGASGDRAAVKKADNRQDATSSKTLGVATEDIPVDSVGFVGTFGVVGKLNLSAYNPGDILYLDSIPGKMTKTKPQAPYHLVFIGVVERANSGNGLLFTNVQNGYELEELHNVRITSPVRNNALLAYDSIRALWVDTTLNAIGGVTGSGTNGYVTKFTASNTIGNSIMQDNGSTINLAGGMIATGDIEGLSIRANNYIQFKNINTSSSLPDYTTLQADSTNKTFRFDFGDGVRIADFKYAAGAYTYNLPSSNGTLALTSDLTGGTVTSVATNNGTGITGGTITTTGTLAIDTLLVSTRAWRQKGVDSLQANINGKVNISDTASMLSPYLRKADTTSMLLNYVNNVGYGLDKAGQVVSVDTLEMSTRAWRQKGIDSVTSLITGGYVPTSRTLTINGTSYDLSANRTWSVGTVTSITGGTGLTGGTITGSGTLAFDTTWGDARYQLALTNPVTGTGNANRIAMFTGTSTIGNSSLYYDATYQNIGIKTAGGPITFKNYSALSFDVNAISGNSTTLQLTRNVSEFDGWLYLNGSAPAMFQITGGNDFTWSNSTSGTAGTTITWNERMRLDASGNLLVNRTSAFSGGTYTSQKLQVTGGIGINSDGADGTARLTLLGNSSTGNATIDWGGNGNFSLLFTNNGNTRATLDASGNLGLGVTPSATTGLTNQRTIEIGGVGNTLFNNGVAAFWMGQNVIYNSGYKYANSAEASYYLQSSGSHIWAIAGSGTAGNAISFTQAMTLDASGRLGIGSTSPTDKLNVVVSSNGNVARLDGPTSGLIFQANATTTDIISYGGSTPAYRTLNFATGASPNMTITTGGNVGIGNTAPINQLDLNNTGAPTLFDAGFKANQNGGEIELKYIAAGQSGGRTGSHIFYTGTTVGGSERMRITSGGNVLVGTTTNASGFSRLILNGSQNYSESGIQVNYGASTNGGFAITTLSAAGGGMSIYTYTGNVGSESYSERMRITSGGDVGIGVTSPGAKLEVNGAIKTAAPSGGTAKPWKLGELVTTGVTVDTTKYIRVEIDGVEYYLATVTIN